MQYLNEKTYFSAPELAKILGITRDAVSKQIRKGVIKAEKVGRTYVISHAEVERLSASGNLTDNQKQEIRSVVEKIVDEYGAAIRKLGKE